MSFVFASGVKARMASPFVEIKSPRLLPRAGVVCSGGGGKFVGVCASGSGLLESRWLCTGVGWLLLLQAWVGAAVSIRSGGKAGAGGLWRVDSVSPGDLVRRQQQRSRSERSRGASPADAPSMVLRSCLSGRVNTAARKAFGRECSLRPRCKLAGSCSGVGDGGEAGLLAVLFVARAEASLVLRSSCCFSMSPFVLSWDGCSLCILFVCVSVCFVRFPEQ